jgi:opacity protein-like surface antigen
MKRLLLSALVLLAAANVSIAQDDDRAPSPRTDGNVAADFADTSAATASREIARALAWSSHSSKPLPDIISRSVSDAPPETAEPTPAAPTPKYVYGSRDDFRWELALGIALVRFRSPFYYATAIGTNTSLTYYTNQWLGVEGNVNTGFAPTIYQNEHVKYVSYGAGPKVAWRGRQLEPWAHGVIGGIHILPKTADNSENGFALQVGGGADYRIYPHLSVRLELDWVKSHVFGIWENSAQANADIVLHF